MTLTNKPRGTQDIYPPRSLLYQKIQQKITEVLCRNNYQPIIFPTFEHVELFINSLGSTTDIVHKEMFIFQDRKNRNLVLRPEGTVSTVRLVCQNKLLRENFPLKFYYWANMFRYERPQKGRHREFWQLGVELINARGIWADYQVLKLVHEVLSSLGIKDFTFSLNYLGGVDTKEAYKKMLREFIEENNLDLCEDCHKRYQTNPLRIIDCLICKKKVLFPAYEIAWDSKDRNYIIELNKILDKFNFPYQYDYYLVRGLDYYTGLVFEVNLGSEKALLGGGRYDKLYQKIGNIDVPAIGFAMGIERLADYLESSQDSELLKVGDKVDVFFFTSVSDFYLDILVWKEKLKKYSLSIDYNLEVKKIKSLPKIIDYYQPKLLVILGEKELKSEKILMKDCQGNQEFLVEKEKLVGWMLDYLKIR